MLEGDITQKFFQAVLELARAGDLVSNDHFSVDGSQIEAWASHKSFQLKEPGGNDDSTSLPPPPSSAGDGGGSNPSVDFRGSTRSNETHESKTNPESRLYKKASGVASKLSFMGHAMMENRNGLVIDARLSEADGTAERDVALGMAFRVSDEHQRKTLGAEMNYDTKTFTGVLKVLDVTPHVAQNHNRNGGSAIDGRTTRHECYAVSQRKRKWIEEIFGWSKTVGPMRRPHLRGRKRLEFWFQFSVAVYNLVRIRNLQAVAA